MTESVNNNAKSAGLNTVPAAALTGDRLLRICLSYGRRYLT